MAEKHQQESFLAQLSEVEVAPVQTQNIVEVLQINPIYEAKVDDLVLTQSTASILPDSHDQNFIQSSTFLNATTSSTEPIQPTNGDALSKIQEDSPKQPNSAPQTVTGNVKIQLMEISVEEFKANVDYIQQRFPTLPRRLVCDTFSKANFDCRMAMELLAKEQEKKDPTIVPPLAAAAAKQHLNQQQQQHHQQVLQSPKSHAPKGPATVTPQQTPQAPGTPTTAPAEAVAVVTPQQPVRQLPLPRTGPRRSQLGAGGAKEDPCYRRVAVPDKEAEIILRQKLKSNVRSRVFNHGVKISQGRETAANLIQQTPQVMEAGETEGADEEEASRASMIVDEGDASRTAASASAAANTSLNSLERSGVEAQVAEVKEDVAPQSPMRILRESFPTMDEARIAETLEICDQDVDAAIRVLSGRPLLTAGASAAASAQKKFFKSRGQIGVGGGVSSSRKAEYVKAELSTGAWMDHRTAGKMASAAGNIKVGANATTQPAVTSLRVFTVQPKRRIKEALRDFVQ